MIHPNATQIKAQAIEVHRSGSGWWNLYDATGQLVARAMTRDNIVEHARIKFHVRDAEWVTLEIECPDCAGADDECERCGGHGALYTAHTVSQ